MFSLDSLSYSLASHAFMIFLQNKALAATPCLYFACGLIKDVGGHPVMYHGACMVR
jgi:hypothetical protein